MGAATACGALFSAVGPAFLLKPERIIPFAETELRTVATSRFPRAEGG